MSVSGKSLWNTRLWLVVGVAAIGLAWLLDNRVDAALLVPVKTDLHAFASWCSKLGEGWVAGIWGIGFAILFLLVNRPTLAAKIFFVALSSELTGLAATILRILFGRTRPNNHDVPQGFYGVWHDGHWIIGQFKFSAFPSGHAAAAVGLATAAWLFNRGWGVVVSVYALAVMWSRIALECHHLSDVVASTVLAIPLAILLKKVLFPTVEFQFGNLNRALRRK